MDMLDSSISVPSDESDEEMDNLMANIPRSTGTANKSCVFPDEGDSDGVTNESETKHHDPGHQLLLAAQRNKLDIMLDLLKPSDKAIKRWKNLCSVTLIVYDEQILQEYLTRSSRSSDPLPNNFGQLNEICLGKDGGESNLCAVRLLENCSLLHFQDSDGYSALHRAAYSGNVSLCALLIACGAKVDVRTEDEWTPLHSSVHWGEAKCAALLLSCGAEVNSTTKRGLTPLHLASSNTDKGSPVETLQLLIMHPGIRADIISNANETARDLASRSSKYNNLFRILDPAVCKLCV